MPKACFFNLPEEKKGRIYAATIMELSKVTADEISINKIIQNADISRGSFYQYFEDKQDLIDHIFKDLNVRIRESMKEELEKYDGDFFIVVENLYERAIKVGEDEHERKIIRNYLLGFRFTSAFQAEMLTRLKLTEEYFVEALNRYQAKNRFKQHDGNFILALSGMVMALFVQNLLNVYSDYENLVQYKKMFYTQLSIIKNGAVEQNQKQIKGENENVEV